MSATHLLLRNSKTNGRSGCAMAGLTGFWPDRGTRAGRPCSAVPEHSAEILRNQNDRVSERKICRQDSAPLPGQAKELLDNFVAAIPATRGSSRGFHNTTGHACDY